VTTLLAFMGEWEISREPDRTGRNKSGGTDEMNGSRVSSVAGMCSGNRRLLLVLGPLAYARGSD
jgi:hypothetical protein